MYETEVIALKHVLEVLSKRRLEEGELTLLENVIHLQRVEKDLEDIREVRAQFGSFEH
jgi:hypothetical protein